MRAPSRATLAAGAALLAALVVARRGGEEGGVLGGAYAWLASAPLGAPLLAGLLGPGGGALGAVTTNPAPPHAALLAAVRNCTTDQEQLVVLLHDFFAAGAGAPDGDGRALERRFVDFLAAHAAASNAHVELWLDWLIWAYKTAAPFILLHFVATLAGGGGGDGEARGGEARLAGAD